MVLCVYLHGTHIYPKVHINVPKIDKMPSKYCKGTHQCTFAGTVVIVKAHVKDKTR